MKDELVRNFFRPIFHFDWTGNGPATRVAFDARKDGAVMSEPILARLDPGRIEFAALENARIRPATRSLQNFTL